VEVKSQAGISQEGLTNQELRKKLLKEQAILEATLANLQDQEVTNKPAVLDPIKKQLAEMIIPAEDPTPEETAPVSAIITNMRKLKDQATTWWQKETAKESKTMKELEEKLKVATAALQEHQELVKTNDVWREEARIAIEERMTKIQAVEDSLKPVEAQANLAKQPTAGNFYSAPPKVQEAAAMMKETFTTKEEMTDAINSLKEGVTGNIFA
jgi:hypothetical protein